jgi:hypothetical protein
MSDFSRGHGTPPPPPPPPGGISRELTAGQNARCTAITAASEIVARVAAADARTGGGQDWEELGEEAMAMAQRFERYVDTGSTEVTA